jgi:hypothetical protein
MRPQPLLFHGGHGQARGVEAGAEVDRQDGVPGVDRELLHRRHVLDAGVVDEQVDGAELRDGLAHHAFDLVGLAHVGRVVADLHVMPLDQVEAQFFDVVQVAEAIEHDVGALGRQ